MSGIRRSIVWKLIAPVPIGLTLAILGIWLFLPSVIADNVRADAVRSAQEIANQFKTIRGYYTKNVIKKVLAQGGIKPSFNHKTEAGTIPLPATFIHDMSELLREKDTSITLYSEFPFPVRGNRRLDGYQAEAWRSLSAEPEGVFVRQETRNGQEVVRVAIADRMVAEACVNCHNSHPASPKTDWKMGDVRGVLEVVTVIEPQLAAGRSLSNKLILTALIGGLIFTLICIVVARGVAKPLTGITEVFDKLAAGDNSVEVPGLDRGDEIGQMARASQSFKDAAGEHARAKEQQVEAEARSQEEQRQQVLRIADMLENSVLGVIEQVESSAEGTYSSSERLDKFAAENSQNCQTVQEASTQASGNMQTISSATEELSASIKEISSQVGLSAQQAQMAVGEAERTNELVSGLSDASQKIGAVIGMINDIAEQTNLLALNATIEAARAGDAGKGFAVVAGEVKSLANQTAKATDDITNQVTTMQEVTDKAVAAIGSIGGIISNIDEITQDISRSIEQQEGATREIAQSVQQTASRTDDVTSNIEQISNSAVESGEEARRGVEVSKSLKACAEDLSREVKDFVRQLRETKAGNRREAPRYKVSRATRFNHQGRTGDCHLVDLSISGALVRADPLAEIGSTVTLEIGGVGSIPAKVMRHAADAMGLRFAADHGLEKEIKSILPLPPEERQVA